MNVYKDALAFTCMDTHAHLFIHTYHLHTTCMCVPCMYTHLHILYSVPVYLARRAHAYVYLHQSKACMYTHMCMCSHMNMHIVT